MPEKPCSWSKHLPADEVWVQGQRVKPGAAKETGGQKASPTRGHTTGVTAKRLADISAQHGRRHGDGKRRSKPLANHGRDGNFRHLVLVPERVSAELSSDKAPAVTSATSQGAGAAATSTRGDGRVASVLTGVGAELRGGAAAEYTMTAEKGGKGVGRSVAGDEFGQEKRRRMRESGFRGLSPGRTGVGGMHGWNFDGEADVKAAVAVKIGETAMSRWQRYKSVSVRLPTQCLRLVCDATAGSRGGVVLVVLRTEGRHEGNPDEMPKSRVDDATEAMGGNTRVPFDGDRKGSKSTSRWAGVPAVAADSGIPIVGSNPPGLLVALRDSPRHD
ncbi:hypothetical protein B0T18DRAFT_394245 [Schizothecium vesticola]|uniref:Uncharacterized protein n=1 Tax=Schizothecium vesticola TaxID=314040 RepID=A0AA40EHA7_9PEZI|nr:hypothetical protein B0T18DRAFT_394245 [Schizothecium vesticola]